MEQARSIMQRTIKDSVFCDLFSEPKYLLKLYQALHPEDTETMVDDIKDVSLRNVPVNAQYNDVGFRIKDRVLLLLEEQTKWSGSSTCIGIQTLENSYIRTSSSLTRHKQKCIEGVSL